MIAAFLKFFSICENCTKRRGYVYKNCANCTKENGRPWSQRLTKSIFQNHEINFQTMGKFDFLPKFVYNIIVENKIRRFNTIRSELLPTINRVRAMYVLSVCQ